MAGRSGLASGADRGERAGRPGGACARRGSVTGRRDLLLVCLSGGASAMLAVPAPGLSLDDKAATTRVLLRRASTSGRSTSCGGISPRSRAGNWRRRGPDDHAGDFRRERAGRRRSGGDRIGTDRRRSQLVRRRARDPGAATTCCPRCRPGSCSTFATGERGLVAGPVQPGDPRLATSAYWIAASRHDAMRAAADTARRLGYQRHGAAPTGAPAPRATRRSGCWRGIADCLVRRA